MKYAFAPALVAILLLAACSNDAATTATTTPQQAAVAQSHASCAEQHPSTRGNFVDQANCLTSDETAAMTPGDPNADLTTKLQTYRLALAKKADAGTITPAIYAQKLHRMEAKIAAQKTARLNKAAATASSKQ